MIFLLGLLCVAVAVNPIGKVVFLGGDHFNFQSNPTLYVTFNSSDTKACRKGTLAFAAASGASVNDECSVPYKSGAKALISFSVVNATAQFGDITLPAPLLAQSAALGFYVSGAPSGIAEAGYLWGRPDGALQLSSYVVRFQWQQKFTFLFSTTLRCQQFVTDVDTDCSLTSACSAAVPSVSVQSPVPSKAPLCAVNNFQQLDWDNAQVNQF